MTNYADVEKEMVEIANQLEITINDYYDVAVRKANAEADWKIHEARIVLKMAESSNKGAEDTRRAKALQTDDANGTPGSELYRAFLIACAEEKAYDKDTYSIQARLSAAQTRAKALRGATGLDDF